MAFPCEAMLCQRTTFSLFVPYYSLNAFIIARGSHFYLIILCEFFILSLFFAQTSMNQSHGSPSYARALIYRLRIAYFRSREILILEEATPVDSLKNIFRKIANTEFISKYIEAILSSGVKSTTGEAFCHLCDQAPTSSKKFLQRERLYLTH